MQFEANIRSRSHDVRERRRPAMSAAKQAIVLLILIIVASHAHFLPYVEMLPAAAALVCSIIRPARGDDVHPHFCRRCSEDRGVT
jgi:hypothetical protein